MYISLMTSGPWGIRALVVDLDTECRGHVLTIIGGFPYPIPLLCDLYALADERSGLIRLLPRLSRQGPLLR